MSSTVVYNSKFSMGYMTLRRFLVIPCKIFLRDHLRNTMIIDILVSISGSVDGLGGVL